MSYDLTILNVVFIGVEFFRKTFNVFYVKPKGRQQKRNKTKRTIS